MSKDSRKTAEKSKSQILENLHRSALKPEDRIGGQGLPLEVVSRWLNERYRRIQQPDEQQQTIGWVEVKPLEQQGSSIEVNIGMYVIHVREGFNRGTFADVCLTLKELC